MRAWARNESYHYGRIRRRMPLENLCTHIHLIRSVAASSRQVGSTRLQSPCHPLPPVLEAMGIADKACPGPAGEVSPGTASEFGHHIATLSTSPLPGPYLLGVIPKSCPIPSTPQSENSSPSSPYPMESALCLEVDGAIDYSLQNS